ncbi:peptide/nickel transport system substrate-binding protein [Paracoccus aminovorans]|uniref:Peptide/nickel transport system substrate-binding protein n=1 Tax=Paracoccus aminovorans TaxID=34004 RepID=A0A1I2XVY2_9RHOB|nr:ABC transporter substrate-binding protein [Paracoccus aminovorans]CQR87216.1 peptide/opine/nickel uptake family ABC transporter, periplasmic substrate-binding protein [Paracoccus aminovorans]SFH17219.1 peptide/nickel transport system substrate-binding protein [Paracoccus aminovorans]
MFARLMQAAALTAAMALPAQAAQDAITLAMVLEPPNLDPTGNAAAAIDEVVYANLFEGLTRIGPDGSVKPGLAESWETADGQTYTFHLRPGVQFHDGSAFDAQDVIFSLDRARAPDSTNAQKALFEGIEMVEALDPHTVRITLKAPDGALPFKLAWGDAVMVDKANVKDIATHPIGTGPFQLGEWKQGDHITLTAFDGYWGTKPALKTATFRFIGDPTAAFAAMMAGDVDAFPIYPAPETLAQLQADPRFKVLVGTTEGETILAMNHKTAALADKRVRKAIAHAINRQELIDGAMFGYGTPIGTHFAPHNPDYLDLKAQSPYDPELSKKLLAEAGVENLTLRLALPPTPYARRGGEILAAELRAVDIQTTTTNMEWAQWLEQVFKNADYDLTVISHVEPMDIGIYGRAGYYFNYANPGFNAVMTKLDAATDPAERTTLLNQAQRIIAEDYANAYLFQLAKTGVAKAEIEGLWENAPMPANDLTAVHWRD